MSNLYCNPRYLNFFYVAAAEFRSLELGKGGGGGLCCRKEEAEAVAAAVVVNGLLPLFYPSSSSLLQAANCGWALPPTSLLQDQPKSPTRAAARQLVTVAWEREGEKGPIWSFRFAIAPFLLGTHARPLWLNLRNLLAATVE